MVVKDSPPSLLESLLTRELLAEPELVKLRPLSSKPSTKRGVSREEAEDDERESGTFDAYRSSLATLQCKPIQY